MSQENQKKLLPPYSPFTTFFNFINNLKDVGIPSHVDKSVMTKMSGSGQSAMLATLKYLKLINNNFVPSEKFIKLIKSDGENYSTILAEIVKENYGFLFDGSIDIKKATSKIVADKFKDQGVSGSTLTKSVSFFLAAAKEAEIEISQHVKPPALVKAKTTKKKTKKKQTDTEVEVKPPEEQKPPGMREFSIPLRETTDGKVFLPEGLTKPQAIKAITMVTFILNNYYGIDEE